MNTFLSSYEVCAISKKNVILSVEFKENKSVFIKKSKFIIGRMNIMKVKFGDSVGASEARLSPNGVHTDLLYDDSQKTVGSGDQVQALQRGLTIRRKQILNRIQQTSDQGKHKLAQAGQITQESSRVLIGHLKTAGTRSVYHIRRTPLCLRLMLSFYHKLGFKHVLLVLAFVLYVCFGALIFVLIEAPAEQRQLATVRDKVTVARKLQVQKLMSQLFNNSRHVLFVRQKIVEGLKADIIGSFSEYEHMYQKLQGHRPMRWDYISAMLYTGSICTTIGYGHVFPRTTAGRILTMIYALGGIPLVLLLLQDVGQLLTGAMKYPWFQCKRVLRRALRYCTKQRLEEMKQIEEEERACIYVFDVPIPVAVLLVVIWVFICASIFSLGNVKMTLIEAFYFFFISLSTVGLGDVIPEEPSLLLMMFGMILIGLSLVSMVINLLQLQLHSTYQVGRSRLGSEEDWQPEKKVSMSHGPVISLGVFQASDPGNSSPASSDTRQLSIRRKVTLARVLALDGPHRKQTRQGTILRKKSQRFATKSSSAELMSRYAQTNISLPQMKQVIMTEDGVHWITDGSRKSPDEVMNLVQTDIDCRVMRDMAEWYEDGQSLTSIDSARIGRTMSTIASRSVANEPVVNSKATVDNDDVTIDYLANVDNRATVDNQYTVDHITANEIHVRELITNLDNEKVQDGEITLNINDSENTETFVSSEIP